MKDEDGFAIAIKDGVMLGLVSRLLWNEHHPEQTMGSKSYPFMTCRNMKCINPAHMAHSNPYKRK
jgi:hypothetical protein